MNLSRESLDRIIQIAKSHDSVEKYISKPTGSPALEVRTKVNQIVSESSPQRRRQGFTGECANCGQRGHPYFNCQQPLDEGRVQHFMSELYKRKGSQTPVGTPSATNPTGTAEGGEGVTATAFVNYQ